MSAFLRHGIGFIEHQFSVSGEEIDLDVAVARDFDTSTQAVHKVKQRIRDRLKHLIAEQIQAEESIDA